MAVAMQTKLRFTEFQVGDLNVGLVRTYADHDASVRILRDNGYEPFTTHQQVFTSIDGNEGLKENLKGIWFHTDIDPRSIGSRDELKGFTEKGEFTESGSNIERNVRVWSGSNPVRVGLWPDAGLLGLGRRYLLFADFRPDYVAPVVVGIKEAGQPIHVKYAGAKTIEEARSSVAKLDAAAEAGVINKEVVKPLKELIRQLE